MLIYGEPAFRTEHANPYNAALYRAMMANGDVVVRDLNYLGLAFLAPKVVHLHWPELTFLSGHRRWRVFARLVLFYSFLAMARPRGTKLVWTVHNVTAHETRSTPYLRRLYRRLLMRNVDAVIVLTESGIAAVRREYPELRRRPISVVPHGHYKDLYDLTKPRDLARAELAVPADSLFVVSAGQIRAYKNVPMLIEAVGDLADDRVVLGVAGKSSDPQLRAEIEEGAAELPRAILELDYLEDARMATWLRAADLVVLPYRNIQNSGSAILALSAGRPVVVPAIGAMEELREMVGDEWVFTYRGDLTGDVLGEAVAWTTSVQRDPDGPDLTQLEWRKVAESTLTAFRRAVALPSRRTP
ncbi:glycosyltransferase family 4 protein [Amnibacterium flavum]|uniref:glycosyltransferase family 4 protein n=1 Tax=Amnibacterium flavum TaxID=2173173 RepID=UPI001401C82C|nr:glycosyltransferase family 4 protein [Amnibacterium flavum]